MELQTSSDTLPTLELGSTVIYGMHGKCSVIAIEKKQINGESLPFVKLEIQKSPLSRSNKQEPAIWLPLANAKERGLRAPMTQEEAQQALTILSSREYYFSAKEAWNVVHPQLESCIRIEGGIGLAKVMSYLFVLKRKLVVPPSDVTRFHELVSKLLLRELSETTSKPIRELENAINKGLRHKLHPDH